MRLARFSPVFSRFGARMGRTCTTRHGNGSGGAGWGGMAKGAGNKAAGPGRPSGDAWHGKTTVADLMAEKDARRIAAEAWLAILNDPAHPKHAEMVAKAAERMDGAPTQRLEVRDADPDTMTDAELEAIARRGSGAPSGAAADTD